MNLPTITKRFSDLPFAHRQHTHDGHCRLIHGHNWAFEFEFACDVLTEQKFVVDFGKLKGLRRWLEEHFDHTLVLNEDDPYKDYLISVLTQNKASPTFAKVVVVPNGGAEELAAWLFYKVNLLFSDNPEYRERGVRVVRVTVFEDSKNSATYREEKRR